MVRVYKPTSPGRRFASVADYSDLTKKRPEKSLTIKLPHCDGRNNYGHFTSKRKSGGNRKLYRIIDFKRDKHDVPARVAALEYDPYRSARIALLHYKDGEKRYIIAPEGLKVGQMIVSGLSVEPEIGNAMPLRAIPVGQRIHNVELTPGRGGQMVKSAGSSARLVAKDGDYGMVELPSGEMRKVHLSCYATIGEVGNADHSNVRIGKAGRSRWMNRKPTSRGVAKFPAAHPMGGGEGRTKGGRHPCSRTGVLSKGGKTRSPRKPSGSFIVRHRTK
ncbi:MAG: 50S ribosomal protein L2 [Candidatus Brocadiia bacterium]